MSSRTSDVSFSWGKYDALWLLQEYRRELSASASADTSSPRPINQAKSLLLTKFDQTQNQSVKIGGINLQFFHDYALVDVLWIDPKFRKQGFGKQLVMRAEEHAKELGLKRLLLSAYEHQNSIEFWKKVGCEEVGRVRDYPQGHQLVYLHKRLA